MHPAILVALRHLLVNDAAPGGHPLDVAGADGAAVAHAVAVLHRSRQDVGDRLDSAVRMPREARQVILRNVIAEVVEQEEWVEVGRIAEPERAAQTHARAFKRRLGFTESLNRSNRHIRSPMRRDAPRMKHAGMIISRLLAPERSPKTLTSNSLPSDYPTMNGILKQPCDEGVILASPIAAPCRQAAKPWILTATILASSMAFIDGTVVNVALGALQREFDATLVGVQWVVEAYALFLASLVLVGGSLGDLYGRRRVFALGIAIFAVASVACGLARDINELILARAIQGIGAALLVPGSLAIIGASFPENERGRAIGTWSGMSAITGAAGPVIGGWLIEHASWRWAFFLNLPLAAVTLAITFWQVPESRGEIRAKRLDWPERCW